MQNNGALDDLQAQLAVDYLTFIGIWQTLQTDSILPYALDSIHAVSVFNLYQSGDNIACLKARDMLVASGLLEYQEPIHDLPDSLKSAVAGVPEIITHKKISSVNDNLTISPNPATNFTVIEYRLPAKSAQVQLTVCNSSGKVFYQKTLTKTCDQLWIDTSNFSSGIYSVSLYVGKQRVKSGNLSIIKN